MAAVAVSWKKVFFFYERLAEIKAMIANGIVFKTGNGTQLFIISPYIAKISSF
jgi:hypothetical protein